MSPTDSDMGMRERVARIVDASAFEGPHRGAAYAKADAILALVSALMREAMEALDGFLSEGTPAGTRYARAEIVHAKLKAALGDRP